MKFNSRQFLNNKILNSLIDLKNTNSDIYNQINIMEINYVTLDSLRPITLPEDLKCGLAIDDKIPTHIINFYNNNDKLFHIEINEDFKFMTLDVN